MNLAIILAFLMVLITASSNIFLKKGFHKINPFLAVYISVLISTVFLWIASFLFVPKCYFLNYEGIFIFIIIGIIAPTVVRSLTYLGIHYLGAGRAAPIRALTPFFATVIAITFLKESPKPVIFLGIILVILSTIVVSKRDNNVLHGWRVVHLALPFFAALLAGLVANLRKYGLNIMPSPIFASTIAATSSLCVLTAYLIFKNRFQSIFKVAFNRELRFIIIAALLTSIGEIVDLSALLFGKVSLVVPIFAMTPLLIVVFSRIFLKKYEVVTKRVVVAVCLTIAGVYITILSVR
jgi:uncharacterized membrane protein